MNQLQKITKVVKGLFGVTLTPGQAEIFKVLIDPDIKRAAIRTTTQYGKSFTIGLAEALDLGDTRNPGRHIIVAPTDAQADIIMQYVRQDIVKIPFLTRGLVDASKVERLQTEFSKDRLAWVDGRELVTLTATATSNSGDMSKGGRSLMGFGGKKIIVDESPLIPDPIFGKIFRMVGADPNAKLVQIGNPFPGQHFFKACHDPNYYQIKIDYRQAIEEGRLTQAFIDEARNTLSPEMFKIMYEAEFVIGTSDGYITPEDFNAGHLFVSLEKQKVAAMNDQDKARYAEKARGLKKVVGVDVAYYGDDESVIAIRVGRTLPYVKRYKKLDTMALVGELVALQKEKGFDWEDVNIDYIGVGVGVVDRLHELHFDVTGVIVSEAPDDDTLYFNKRAELWGRMKDGIREGLEIEDGELKAQVLAPKYEYRYKNTGVVRKLESKETMKKRGIGSPDIADAVALTYYESKGYFADSIGYFNR